MWKIMNFNVCKANDVTWQPPKTNAFLSHINWGVVSRTRETITMYSSPVKLASKGELCSVLICSECGDQEDEMPWNYFIQRNVQWTWKEDLRRWGKVAGYLEVFEGLSWNKTCTSFTQSHKTELGTMPRICREVDLTSMWGKFSKN